jgi:hypothetical protein
MKNEMENCNENNITDASDKSCDAVERSVFADAS